MLIILQKYNCLMHHIHFSFWLFKYKHLVLIVLHTMFFSLMHHIFFYIWWLNDHLNNISWLLIFFIGHPYFFLIPVYHIHRSNRQLRGNNLIPFGSASKVRDIHPGKRLLRSQKQYLLNFNCIISTISSC